MSPDCSSSVQFGALWLIDQGLKQAESEISITALALFLPPRGRADKLLGIGDIIIFTAARALGL
jgi:hypothetical protein